MTPLATLLAEQIHQNGPVPFSSFMAAALYHPAHGYYCRGEARTGRKGDFFTSVSVGPVFGRIMGSEFCAAWERLGRPPEFTVIEAGANDGQFACDVLSWARSARPDFFEALRYQIDEHLPAMEDIQRRTLAEFAGCVTHDQLAPVEHGFYFANELLDAIPVRRVQFSQGKWHELLVAWDASRGFHWVLQEPEDTALKRRLEWLGEAFPEGYTTEIAPAVASQIRLAAARLKKGYVVFADYGYAAPDYYAPHRTAGTLRCYRSHRAHEDPFDAIGETDLTAHADFSLAAVTAAQAGCHVAGFVDQSRYLTAAATDLLKTMEAEQTSSAAWHRQFQTLTHPAHLGSRFHFLVLAKNVDGLQPLPGLAFARSSAVQDLLAADFPAATEAGLP